MKKAISHAPVGFALLGLCASVLYTLLIRTADEWGRLPRGSALTAALWLLLLLAAAGAAALSLYQSCAEMEGRFPHAAEILLGVGCALTKLPMEGLGTIGRILGIAAGAALVWAGLRGFSGKTKSLLGPAVLTVFLVVAALAQYQHWSENPQTITFLFPLGGLLCLMLSAYFRAAACAGVPAKKLACFSGLFGIFLCFASLNGENFLFYVSGGLWLLSGAISLKENKT